MLTRRTKRLTRKSPNCLKKRVGGMNPGATRMGTSCFFKYVPLIHLHHAHVYASSQRLYQALTSPTPPSGPPYVSSTNFASLRAGPGTARPLHSSSDSEKLPAVTTFRVSSKDRTFVDEVTYRGWSVKLADWLHLSNPDDPSKPIIAQVFKCYVSDEP